MQNLGSKMSEYKINLWNRKLYFKLNAYMVAVNHQDNYRQILYFLLHLIDIKYNICAHPSL